MFVCFSVCLSCNFRHFLLGITWKANEHLLSCPRTFEIRGVDQGFISDYFRLWQHTRPPTTNNEKDTWQSTNGWIKNGRVLCLSLLCLHCCNCRPTPVTQNLMSTLYCHLFGILWLTSSILSEGVTKWLHCLSFGMCANLTQRVECSVSSSVLP